jgi:Cu-Zn family superoxide dismutase
MAGRLGFAVLFSILTTAADLRAQNATAGLQPTQGNNVRGTISLSITNNHVRFAGTVTGLSSGRHGFHIHENGDCSAPDGASAGGHFNPGRTTHGAPNASERHAGDLGNIEADANGVATVDIVAEGITLGVGPRSILGKAIIVHADPDDFSQPTGNAGARLACGIIK